MELAKAVRKCLHAYGIHSATIQPEFCLDRAHDHGELPGLGLDGPSSRTLDDNSCLLECVDDCMGQGCCSGNNKVESQHDHSEHDGHVH